LLLAQFSLAGFPLLASYPLLLQLWGAIGSQSILPAFMLLIGIVGLVIAGFRTMVALFKTSEPQAWQISETRSERWLLALGCGMLLLIGLLPQWFYPTLFNLANLISVSAP